jgi:hypothetical protein
VPRKWPAQTTRFKCRADRIQPYPAISDNWSASGREYSRTEAVARGIAISALSSPRVVSVDCVLLPYAMLAQCKTKRGASRYTASIPANSTTRTVDKWQKSAALTGGRDLCLRLGRAVAQEFYLWVRTSETGGQGQREPIKKLRRGFLSASVHRKQPVLFFLRAVVGHKFPRAVLVFPGVGANHRPAAMLAVVYVVVGV